MSDFSYIQWTNAWTVFLASLWQLDFHCNPRMIGYRQPSNPLSLLGSSILAQVHCRQICQCPPGVWALPTTTTPPHCRNNCDNLQTASSLNRTFYFSQQKQPVGNPFQSPRWVVVTERRMLAQLRTITNPWKQRERDCADGKCILFLQQ